MADVGWSFSERNLFMEYEAAGVPGRTLTWWIASQTSPVLCRSIMQSLNVSRSPSWSLSLCHSDTHLPHSDQGLKFHFSVSFKINLSYDMWTYLCRKASQTKLQHQLQETLGIILVSYAWTAGLTVDKNRWVWCSKLFTFNRQMVSCTPSSCHHWLFHMFSFGIISNRIIFNFQSCKTGHLLVDGTIFPSGL